jgi:hypothetical protein
MAQHFDIPEFVYDYEPEFVESEPKPDFANVPQKTLKPEFWSERGISKEVIAVCGVVDPYRINSAERLPEQLRKRS